MSVSCFIPHFMSLFTTGLILLNLISTFLPHPMKGKVIGLVLLTTNDRIPSTTPGEEPPRDAKDSGSARSHSTHLETSSSNQP